MLESLRTLIIRYQELSVRERVMLGAAIVAVGYFAVDMLLVTPQLEQRKALAAKARTLQAENDAMRAMLNTRSTAAADVLLAARSERDKLQASVSEGERLVNAARQHADAAPLLRSMVQATPGLRLAALRTSPGVLAFQAPAPARPASAASASKAAPVPAVAAVDIPPLYVKAVDATVQGNYMDLLAWLRRVKEYPQPLFWDSATVTVGNYPEASLRLVVNLLTTEPDKATAATR